MTRHGTQRRRSTSTPQRILSTGLATAACIGVVGMLGARTIEANAASAEADPVDLAVAATPVTTEAAPAAATVTSSSGLTQEQLDAYAADLAKEAARLDAYRAKLVKTAKKLQRAAAARESATVTTWSAPSTVPAAPAAKKPASKPAAKPAAKPKASKPAQQPAAQPQAQPAQPAQPQAAPAPAAKQAPAQQQAKPQSTTKGS